MVGGANGRPLAHEARALGTVRSRRGDDADGNVGETLHVFILCCVSSHHRQRRHVG